MLKEAENKADRQRPKKAEKAVEKAAERRKIAEEKAHQNTQNP